MHVVIFATNSARQPSAVPACDGLQGQVPGIR
jgi:hypothetical protein